MKGLLSGILLLACFSIFMACGKKQLNPGESLAVYLEAMKAGDYTTYSRGFAGIQVADTLANDSLLPNLMRTYGKYMQEKCQGLQSFEVVGDSLFEDGQQAFVRVKLMFGNGESEETEYEMIQEGEEWKINLAN